MINEILIMGIIGFVFGIILAYLSIKWAVKGDAKVDEIMKVLPGVNCGACGYPGCRGFAEAVVKGEADPNSCKIGREKAGEKIKAILGI